MTERAIAAFILRALSVAPIQPSENEWLGKRLRAWLAVDADLLDDLDAWVGRIKRRVGAT